MARDVGDSWQEVYANMGVDTDGHELRKCPGCGYQAVTDTFGEPRCQRCDWTRTGNHNKDKGCSGRTQDA